MERLRELEARGFIGELADPCYTFMGGVYSARRAREKLASRFAQIFADAPVDLVFLVPA